MLDTCKEPFYTWAVGVDMIGNHRGAIGLITGGYKYQVFSPCQQEHVACACIIILR